MRRRVYVNALQAVGTNVTLAYHFPCVIMLGPLWSAHLTLSRTEDTP